MLATLSGIDHALLTPRCLMFRSL